MLWDSSKLNYSQKKFSVSTYQMISPKSSTALLVQTTLHTLLVSPDQGQTLSHPNPAAAFLNPLHREEAGRVSSAVI